MKKVIALATVVVLALALAGCSSQASRERSSAMSASDVSASSSTTAASSSSATVNWTQVDTPEAAAQGAQISAFGVPYSIMLADITFASPTFGYAEHAAQAVYEVSGTAKLVIRKGEGAHAASLTDRDKSEFKESWKNTYEGMEVTSYGDTQGAATICVWNDGTKEYGVTIEGLGSNAVTMDAEDIDDVVKAVKVSENPVVQQPSQGSSQAATPTTPGFDVQKVAASNGLGQFVRYYYVQGENGTYYWAIVTLDTTGKQVTTYVDANGNITKTEVEVGSRPTYDGADFDVAAWCQSQGVGRFIHYYWIPTENGKGIWAIVSEGSDGKEVTSYADEQGNRIS